MKRISILLSALILAFSMQAQNNMPSNYIGYNVGGGMNTLTYKPVNGSWNPSWGFLGELKYAHFFGAHFGVGFGVQYNMTHAGTLYDFTETSTGLTHVDNTNAHYDLNTVFDNWHERQAVSFLSIPVELYWRAALSDRWAFLLGLGAQIDLPLNGEYTATEGAYRTEGYFPALGYAVSNLPDHGFRNYDADFKSDVTLNKTGVSVIADLGFNYTMCNHWGLYLGIYGGYGITNLIDSTSTKPVLSINEADASKLDYNGTLASNQIDALHLLNVGAKIGVNLGWNCHSRAKASASDENDLVEYDTPEETKAAEPAVEEEPEEAIEVVEEPAKETVESTEENTSEETEEASEEPEQTPAYTGYDNNFSNNTEEEESEEEIAAREARCNARRMNNPDMAHALSSIDADLDEAEQIANEADNSTAKEAVADARAKAADAKNAYKNGQYCKAYDLFNEAYGDLADSYAADANSYAAKSNDEDATKAADDAALYADAAHKDGLGCAMAASRNARLNNEIARTANTGDRKAGGAYNDPNYANHLANEALTMAEDASCKPAKVDAKDASGKAYRGNLADSYAACASSFAKSANVYASGSNNAEAQAAADEAQRFADEAADAARMGDTAGASRAARAAQQAAERARRLANGGDANKPSGNNTDNNGVTNGQPADRAQLQQYLDQINATVLFDFSSTEPKFDRKTDLAIRALCAAMKADRNVKVLITGHTDNVGTAESNMNYGKQRAEALKQLMVNQGAPAASIKTASKGQEEPVVDNDTDEHRHQNRRAVITLR